jgi:hypothetical protein
MQKRIWINSGVVEDFDVRQQRLLSLVLENVEKYYRDHYETRSMYRYPLSLSRLARMCNRSKPTVLAAVRVLANSNSVDGEEASLFYDRISSGRNASHRPYRIFKKLN